MADEHQEQQQEEQPQQSADVGQTSYLSNKVADAVVARTALKRVQNKLSTRTKNVNDARKIAHAELEKNETPENQKIFDKAQKKYSRSRAITKAMGGEVENAAGGVSAEGWLGKTMRFAARGWKSGAILAATALVDIGLGYNQNGINGAKVAAGDAAVILPAAYAGGELGVVIGATVGSLLGPVGTVVGGVVGGFIGGSLAAGAAHEYIIPKLHEAETDWGLTLDHPQKTSADYIQDGFSWVGHKLGAGLTRAGHWGVNAVGRQNIPFMGSPDAQADATKPDGQKPDASLKEQNALNKSDVIRQMRSIPGEPDNVKMLVSLGSDKEGDYGIKNGSGPSYMAVVRQVRDPRYPDDADRLIWQEVGGRVQDIPANRNAEAQRIASQTRTVANSQINISAPQTYQNAGTFPAGIPAAPGTLASGVPVTTYPSASAGLPDDQLSHDARVAQVRARWINGGGNKVGEAAARSDLTTISPDVQEVMFRYREGGLFEKNHMDFYTPADPANPYLMKRSLTLSAQDGQEMLKTISDNPSQARAMVLERGGSQNDTPTVAPPVNNLAGLRGVQANAPVVVSDQVIGGTGGMYGYSDVEGGKVALFRHMDDGSWNKYTTTTAADKDKVIAGLQMTSGQFQGDNGNRPSPNDLRTLQSQASTDPAGGKRPLQEQQVRTGNASAGKIQAAALVNQGIY